MTVPAACGGMARRVAREDRGSGGVLIVGICGAMMAATLGLLGAFSGFTAAQRAAAAADAAALAAADVASGLLPGDPCDAAAAVARANGAELTACEWAGDEARVEVSVTDGPFTLADAARAGQPPSETGGISYPLAGPFMMTDAYGPRAAPVPGASSDHPAVDLVGRLGDPVLSIQAGTVVAADALALTIESEDGTRVSYLHMYPSDHLVAVGDRVGQGEQIGRVGNAGPSSGPHLDLRIDVIASTNAALRALPVDPAIAATYPSAQFVDPEHYFRLHGLELCPPDWCALAR